MLLTILAYIAVLFGTSKLTKAGNVPCNWEFTVSKVRIRANP